MSKAQRYKQQIKDQKAKAKGPPAPAKATEEEKLTLRQRQAANKEALRKHQASMSKLKEFEAKLHPAPAGGAAASEPEKEKSALADMFYDGGNLSKDASRTIPLAAHGRSAMNKDVSPMTGTRSVAAAAQPQAHEKNTAIKM